MSDDAGATLPPFGAYRSYLKVLATATLPPAARRHLDDSDLVQQTLLEAHRARDAFRGKTVPAQKAWLRKILARNIADAMRALRRERRDIAREQSFHHALERSSTRLERWLESPEVGPDERMAIEERAHRVTTALAALPADQRTAVVYRHLHGLSLERIAERMGRTRQATAGLVHRGLAALRRNVNSEAHG